LQLGREPSELELRDASGFSPILFKVTRQIAEISTVPIGDTNDERRTNANPEPADDEPPPLARLEQQQLIGALQEAVDNLPQRQRLVVGLYYRERLTYREIAGLLQVSESRVSQLMKQALKRLRAHSALVQATRSIAA
jgi:RNA polymerase sigma factor for flagellar operon FliA